MLGVSDDPVRSAVVRDCVTLMLNHCKYPSTHQKEVVAARNFLFFLISVATGHVKY